MCVEFTQPGLDAWRIHLIFYFNLVRSCLILYIFSTIIDCACYFEHASAKIIVYRVIIHPQYNKLTFQNYLTLIKMDGAACVLAKLHCFIPQKRKALYAPSMNMKYKPVSDFSSASLSIFGIVIDPNIVSQFSFRIQVGLIMFHIKSTFSTASSLFTQNVSHSWFHVEYYSNHLVATRILFVFMRKMSQPA